MSKRYCPDCFSDDVADRVVDGVHDVRCEDCGAVVGPGQVLARPPGPPPAPIPRCALCRHPFREHDRLSGWCRAEGCGCVGYGTGEFA